MAASVSPTSGSRVYSKAVQSPDARVSTSIQRRHEFLHITIRNQHPHSPASTTTIQSNPNIFNNQHQHQITFHININSNLNRFNDQLLPVYPGVPLTALHNRVVAALSHSKTPYCTIYLNKYTIQCLPPPDHHSLLSLHHPQSLH